MENLPLYVYLAFEVTVSLGVVLFYRAANYSKMFLIVVFALIAFQSILGIAGVYKMNINDPPKFPLLVFPSIIIIALLFVFKKGKTFLDGMSIQRLTIFHSIRILVELGLFWLFVSKTAPQLVTFEGRNFDILAGLSAPFVYYYGFVKNKLTKSIILVWNLVCLVLVCNAVFLSVFSTPTKIQKFAFDQPNIALGYFPFVLLPAILVPLVLLAHLTSVRQLIRKVK